MGSEGVQKSKVKLKHVKTKEAALKKIVTTIQEVLTVFILAKKDRHLQEDFEFVDPIRDLFDLRLWDQNILTRSVYEDEKSFFCSVLRWQIEQTCGHVRQCRSKF